MQAVEEGFLLCPSPSKPFSWYLLIMPPAVSPRPGVKLPVTDVINVRGLAPEGPPGPDGAPGTPGAPGPPGPSAIGAIVDVRDFGAVADFNGSATGAGCTDNLPAFLAALNSAPLDYLGVPQGIILIYPGDYWLSAELPVYAHVIFWGNGSSDENKGPGSSLNFPKNCNGVRFASGYEIDPRTGLNSTAAYGSIYNTLIRCADPTASANPTTTTGHGLIFPAPLAAYSCNVIGFAWNGYELIGDTGYQIGNGSISFLQNCRAGDLGRHGFHIFGGDANVIQLSQCTAQNTRGWGIRDESGQGSTIISHHGEGSYGEIDFLFGAILAGSTSLYLIDLTPGCSTGTSNAVNQPTPTCSGFADQVSSGQLIKVAGATPVGSIGADTITANHAASTFVRSAGSWIADGFVLGDIIRTEGFAVANNNWRWRITNIAALTLTVVAVENAVTVADEVAAPGAVSVIGVSTVSGSTLSPTIKADLGGVVCTAHVGTNKLERASGSWIADGFAVDDFVRVYGFTTPANNGLFFRITAINATELTFGFETLADEVAPAGDVAVYRTKVTLAKAALNSVTNVAVTGGYSVDGHGHDYRVKGPVGTNGNSAQTTATTVAGGYAEFSINDIHYPAMVVGGVLASFPMFSPSCLVLSGAGFGNNYPATMRNELGAEPIQTVLGGYAASMTFLTFGTNNDHWDFVLNGSSDVEFTSDASSSFTFFVVPAPSVHGTNVDALLFPNGLFFGSSFVGAHAKLTGANTTPATFARVGDLILNTDPALGEPFAWRCLTGGTPGTYENLYGKAYAFTPADSADAGGQEGDVTYDASFLYVKTAAGWRRVAIGAF